MNETIHELLITVEPLDTAAADDTRLEQLTRSLRRELLDTDVAAVQQVSAGELPPGAKAAELLAWQALRMLLDPAILSSVLGTLVSWVRRNEGTLLKLGAGDCVVELKGSEVEPEALQKMLEACLQAGLERTRLEAQAQPIVAGSELEIAEGTGERAAPAEASNPLPGDQVVDNAHDGVGAPAPATTPGAQPLPGATKATTTQGTPGEVLVPAAEQGQNDQDTQ